MSPPANEHFWTFAGRTVKEGRIEEVGQCDNLSCLKLRVTGDTRLYSRRALLRAYPETRWGETAYLGEHDTP